MDVEALMDLGSSRSWPAGVVFCVGFGCQGLNTELAVRLVVLQSIVVLLGRSRSRSPSRRATSTSQRSEQRKP